MKVVLLMVSSINGKVTKGADPNIYTWTSKEDQEKFFKEIKKYNLIVMGRNTYDSAKKIMKLSSDQLRIILTRNPDNFKKETVPDQLEFSNESPTELIKRLGKKGYDKMLLVGGGEINTLFLKLNLIDEIHLTIEPQIFGSGKTLINESELDVQLKLLKIYRLSSLGTLHLVYKIIK